MCEVIYSLAVEDKILSIFGVCSNRWLLQQKETMSEFFKGLAAVSVFAVGSILLQRFHFQMRQKCCKNKCVEAVAAATAAAAPVMENESVAESDHRKSLETILTLPCVEFSAFFNKDKDPAAYMAECKKAAEAFRLYGVCAVRDPRVDFDDNERFLDMVEKYFEMSDGKRDARPNYHFQVGVTPEDTELPRNHCAMMGAYGPDDKPLTPCPPEKDAKWRFFWRIGDTPKETKFPALNAEPVIPPEFPEWESTMNMWGYKMLNAQLILAEMMAVGFGMAPDAFTSRMQNGPHLLAPTGSDFKKYGDLGHILAGFHYDLNFMTIHGKCRFPGLSIWTREGKKTGVVVPDGCLLVQAGKQYEILTGGYIMAGYHEVVVTPATQEVISKRFAAGKSLWRVSSTLFSHIQSDQALEPLAPFNTPEAMEAYPSQLAGDMVRKELEVISLHRE